MQPINKAENGFKKKMEKMMLYAKRHLSLRDGINFTTKEPYKAPNFGDGLQKRIINEVKEVMLERGYEEMEVREMWVKETGVNKTHCDTYFRGIRKGMQVWELEHLVKTFGMTLELKSTPQERFAHSMERDRLIIKCRHHPEFYINMNTEKFLDFELEFRFKIDATRFSQNRLNKIFKKMIEFYFLKKAINKKIPFKYDVARKLFEAKCIDIREKLDEL